MNPCVGCAGWSIQKALGAEFPADGTHLQRYATRFNVVEINSSFYRPHRHATYVRWADSTPPGFRFSVKMPKAITHDTELTNCDDPLARFLSETQGLGAKLGAILVQLPPQLRWNLKVAKAFFRTLRARTSTPIVCEPRHKSWFTAPADQLFNKYSISRVLADPPIKGVDAAKRAIGNTTYFRLHGHPRMYYSSYDDRFLNSLATQMNTLAHQRKNVWCIFDNTASGAAMENALTLQSKLKRTSGR
jgi:uncharacterized protein YecE (DUF72 family)